MRGGRGVSGGGAAQGDGCSLEKHSEGDVRLNEELHDGDLM